MPLFRWRFGARDSGTPAAAAVGCASPDGTNDNSNPPPSYEESQDASLRAVLQGAIAVAPILWPSAVCFPSSSDTIYDDAPSSLLALGDDECRCLDTGGGKDEEKRRNPKRATPTGPSAEEEEEEGDAIMEVLANLAMAPTCGDHPFLGRIREFSDFYFTPYIASEGAAILPSSSSSSSSSQEKASGGRSSSPTRRETRKSVVTNQERQRDALQSFDVPRESAALVLCARVLEDYYAGLGHVDSTVDIDIDMDIAQETSAPYQQPPKGEKPSSGAQSAKREKNEPSPGQPRTKTRLTQIVSCLEEGCACCDYDEVQQPKTDVVVLVLVDNSHSHSHSPSTTTITTTTPAAPPQRCGCGHPRTSHAPSPLGISRLLRRYTNWHSGSYTALGHRSSTGQTKRRIHDIEACGAPGGCPCRDYDKGRRTGRCARCGHYYEAHKPIKAAREPDKNRSKKREKGKGKGKGGSSTTEASDLEKAEWELSWILVENAYLLLNHITPISRSKHS